MKRLIVIGLCLVLGTLLFAGTQVFVKETASPVPVAKHESPVLQPCTPGSSSVLPPAGTRDPRTLDDVIISENFEAVAVGSLPADWTQVDVDQGYCAQFSSNSIWRVYNYGSTYSHSGVKVCMNHYNDGGLANDDWLILPQETLAAPITLTYWMATQQAAYPETYELRVSTTGTDPADFTDLIYTGSNIPVAWTQHTHDLSTYAGAPFYIAFHYISVDMFVIKLDDLLLEAGAAAPHGAISGTVTDSATTQPLAGAVVQVVGTDLADTTDAAGLYLIGDIPVGNCDLSFARNGYIPRTVTGVAVAENDTTTVNVVLVSSGVVEVINEDFEAVEVGSLPAGWTQVDVDQGYCAQFSSNSIWRVYNYGSAYSHSGVNVCLDHYNDGGLANDDWLILPQQTLAAPITLTYWMATQQAAYPETYELRVSTTGTDPADFTYLIYTGANIPAAWTQHTHDLSTYAGAPFYIAFHYISVDMFVIKLDDLVLQGGSAAADHPISALPGRLAFYGNYPNPFNARTEFQFDLTRNGHVELALFDVLGRQVARVLDSDQTAGTHVIPFDASALSSGVYFAQLSAEGRTLTHKVMLLK